MLKKLDKRILYTTLLLVFIGSFIFFSASLSELKDTDFFTSVFSKQIISISLGLIAMFFIAQAKFFNGKWLRKNTLYIFVTGMILQLLVLIPGLGMEEKGAKRWVSFDFITVQPSEFFKYTFIIFLSALIVVLGKKLKDWKYFFKFVIYLFIPLISFFIYIHDYGTLMTILFASATILFISSEIKYRYIFVPFFFLIIFLIPILYNFVPYVNDRLEVYINPASADLHGDYYQLNQMMITIGSGELYGRGFGGSLQKFSGLLPEPLGDSIFPVYSEEFGFIGSVLLILLFLLFLFFILSAAIKLKNKFEKMVVVGLGVLLVFPAFYNISSSLEVVPLSGMPITFISKGGTAMLFSLLIVGVILSLTKKSR